MIDDNPEVASYYHQSKEQAFETWKRVYIDKDKSEQEIYSTVKAADMQESYWVKLKDPNQYRGVEGALSETQGVAAVRDLRQVLKPIYFWITVMKWGAIAVAGFLLVAAILQVGNTIRLAAYARRKEIGIMRLVGASNLYISLPFLMETLVAAIVGIGLSSLAVLSFMQFVIYGRLRPSSNIVEWVDWRRRAAGRRRHRGAGRAAHPDPDTRDDAQIPQSVTTVGYGRAVHFPKMNGFTGGPLLPPNYQESGQVPDGGCLHGARPGERDRGDAARRC